MGKTKYGAVRCHSTVLVGRKDDLCTVVALLAKYPVTFGDPASLVEAGEAGEPHEYFMVARGDEGACDMVSAWLAGITTQNGFSVDEEYAAQGVHIEKWP